MREMGYAVAVPASAAIPQLTVPVMNELPIEPESVIEPEELQKKEVSGMDSALEDIRNQSEAAMRERITAIRQNPQYASLVARIRTILDTENKQAQ